MCRQKENDHGEKLNHETDPEKNCSRIELENFTDQKLEAHFVRSRLQEAQKLDYKRNLTMRNVQLDFGWMV